MKLSFQKKHSIKSPSPRKKVMMENFFDDFCASQAKSSIVKEKFDMTSFILDVADNGNHYEVIAQLPGVKEKNIDVTYNDKHLTISAYRKSDTIQKGISFLRQERCYGRVSRSLFIDSIDETSMKVTFESGVLKITMDKLSNKEVD